MPPGKRPSTGIAARKGRERPRLRLAKAAPRPTAGSLTPHMSVFGDVLGRRTEAHVHRHGFLDAMTLARMSLAVAPVSILRKHLGASRLRSLTLTATRP